MANRVQKSAAFWFKDLTRKEMWPFMVGFGVVGWGAQHYFNHERLDAAGARPSSKYARQIDDWKVKKEFGYDSAEYKERMAHYAHKH